MIRKFIIYPLQYLIFLEIYFFFRMLPLKLSSNFGGTVFKTLGPLTKTHKTVINNLKNIFKKDLDKNISFIAKKSWENLGRTIAELSHLNEITKLEKGKVSIKGSEYLNKLRKNKEQAIFVAIHQSNWEILAPILITFGIKINSVYRHINNPFIDRFILNVRKKAYKSYLSILSPKGKKSAQDMIQSIKNDFSIALLIDQKDSSGINIPLLENSAKTQIGFIKLAKKFNLKIYPIENRRSNNINFEMIIHKPLEFFNKKNKITEEEAMSQIHQIIGSWIKEQPENWLWQHKRWG